MKILYVGRLAIPIRDVLTGKNESEITGWPAYFQPVYRLLKQGNELDFVIISDLKSFDIKVDWLKSEQIVENVFIDENKRSRFGLFSKVFYKFYHDLKFKYLVKNAIKRKKYDFVYCQEIDGYWGNVYANKYHVPCGVRVYGDTFYSRGKTYSKYEYIKKHGILGLFLLSPRIVKLYKSKKSFMLTTADGTHGDETYEYLKPKHNSYDFYYWKTGVDKKPPVKEEDLEDKIRGLDFVVYPARVDALKRQDVAIDVLSSIHSKGYKLHLFLIGQVSNERYFRYLGDRIKKYGLEEYVHFTGGVTQNQVKIYAQHSIAALLTSDLSNRGNVFFELFSIGVPIISFNDGSLDGYIENEKNGFLADDVLSMTNYLINIIISPSIRDRISRNAIRCSKEKVLSSEERFSLEIRLIKKYALEDSKIILPSKL